MKNYIDFSESGYATLTETARRWSFSLSGEMADYVREFMNEKGVVLRDAIDRFLDNEIKTFQLIKSELNSQIVNQIIDKAISKLCDTEFSGKAIALTELSSVSFSTIRAIKQSFQNHEKNQNFMPTAINSPKAAFRIETFQIWLETMIQIHTHDKKKYRDFFTTSPKNLQNLYEETLALM